MLPTFRVLLFTTCATVIAITDATAQRSLAEGSKDLATQVAAGATKEQKRRIAVVPFRQLGGRVTILGEFLAEELVSNLFTMGTMDIVERSLLDEVFGELKLDASGVIDPLTAKQVGKVAGVDAVVTGTITELESYIAVNCRMIDAQTGRVFAAAQTRIVKDTELRRIMQPQGADSGSTGGAAQESQPAGARATDAVARTQRVTTEGVVFELTGCRQSGTSVTCQLTVSSPTDDVDLSISQESKAFDGGGNEHSVKAMTLGNKSGSSWMGPTAKVVQGVATPASLTFEDVPGNMAAFALLELEGYVNSAGGRPGRSGHLTANFRKVLLEH